MVNGIVYDEIKNKIYIADSIGKTIREYSVNFSNGEINLEIEDEIYIGYTLDNLELDKSNNTI